MAQALGLASITFAVIAAYFLYIGFGLDISVQTGGGGTVANLQMMHLQATNIAIGIGAAIVAAIFATGAAIISSRG